MAEEVDVIEHLSDLLACGDTRSVKAIINEESFENVLQERASDLIVIASYYLSKESVQNTPAAFRYSEKIVNKCAEKGNPKECLIEFLGQIESLDRVKFQVLLKPVQTVLLRIPEKRSPLMQCVFNVVYFFINSLPLPKYHHLDEKSKLLLDCDDNAQRIRDVYVLLVAFYEPFVDEIIANRTVDKRAKNVRLVLLQALFQSLGNPVVALDLELNEKGSSALRTLVCKVVNLILKLQRDPLQLLTLVEDKQLVSVDEEKLFIKELSSNEIPFSNLSFSVFFYLILCENKSISLPCVYNIFYLFENGLSLAITLLQYKGALEIRKGLLLTKAILGSVVESSVKFSYLTSNVHKELIELLSNIAVYQEVEENRRLAAELIKKHFYTFEPKAQFYILLNSVRTGLHPNVVGFLTTMLTNLVRSTFDNDQLKVYFTGKRLIDLLNVFCSLQKGVETDLIQNKDHILSALNLIIFLTQRDRENVTGVWTYTASLEKTFLEPLKKGLDLSRAHHKLELESLKDPLKTSERADIDVSVGGQELDRMSVKEKREVINSSLTVFDLIEHLLSRANECIQTKPEI